MKEVSALNIKKLVFKNFKTLEEVSFEPGRVNVFIGANGSGKTTIQMNRIQPDETCGVIIRKN